MGLQGRDFFKIFVYISWFTVKARILLSKGRKLSFLKIIQADGVMDIRGFDIWRLDVWGLNPECPILDIGGLLNVQKWGRPNQTKNPKMDPKRLKIRKKEQIIRRQWGGKEEANSDWHCYHLDLYTLSIYTLFDLTLWPKFKPDIRILFQKMLPAIEVVACTYLRCTEH